jgi:hypothetical protein
MRLIDCSPMIPCLSEGRESCSAAWNLDIRADDVLLRADGLEDFLELMIDSSYEHYEVG